MVSKVKDDKSIYGEYEEIFDDEFTDFEKSNSPADDFIFDEDLNVEEEINLAAESGDDFDDDIFLFDPVEGEEDMDEFEMAMAYPAAANVFNEFIPPSVRERRRSRQAKVKMTPEEYREELARLNENAENKNYIFLFGVANSGKSFIIASLLHYMTAYSHGNTRLNRDVATERESLLYNQMLEMFTNPEKAVARTDVSNFYELNIVYEPEDENEKPVEITFIDAAGEHFERAYDGEEMEQVGELPDYLNVILESDVNCKFVFVYDQSLMAKVNTKKAPQEMVLKALYDKVRGMQRQHNEYYPKILLLSKTDKITEEDQKKYFHSSTEYSKAAENGLNSFANGFFSEKDNRSIFYRIGEFTEQDSIKTFDEDCPQKLFDWIYGSIDHIDNTEVQQKLSLFGRLKRWFMGS